MINSIGRVSRLQRESYWFKSIIIYFYHFLYEILVLACYKELINEKIIVCYSINGIDMLFFTKKRVFFF